jgi:hypothetical protein
MNAHTAPRDDTHPQPGPPTPGKNTVKTPLTPKRPRRAVENDEYRAFTLRILRAYSRRVGSGDIDALSHMADLADTIDTAIAAAVVGLRQFGYSWADIGNRLGVTRQAAQQRWGQPAPHLHSLPSPRERSA